MLTFMQFLEELSQRELVIPAPEVRRMHQRFGTRVLQMGKLQEDGSLAVPLDCVLEAVQTLGSQTLTKALHTLKSAEVLPMLESAEVLIARINEARQRKLSRLIEEFQSEPDDVKAHKEWKQIEKMIFGVDFPE